MRIARAAGGGSFDGPTADFSARQSKIAVYVLTTDGEQARAAGSTSRAVAEPFACLPFVSDSQIEPLRRIRPVPTLANALDRQANRPQDRGLTRISRRPDVRRAARLQPSKNRSRGCCWLFLRAGGRSATPYLRQLPAKRAGGRNVALLRGVFKSGSKKKGQAPLLIDEMPRGRGLSPSTKGLQPCPESELCLRCF